jgi:Cu2+-exporting ATPase
MEGNKELKESCAHCLGDIKDGDAVYDEIDSRRLAFCCTGCNAIYRIIHDAGLEQFYERRLGWRPGRPEISEVSPEDFTDYIKKINDGVAELEFLVSGIRCASCIWLIEHLLKKTDGVIDIRINYATHRARLRWVPEKIGLDEILKKISSLGYTPRPALAIEAEEEMKREKRDLLIRLGTASFFTMQLMLYTLALYAGYFQGIEENIRRLFQWIAWALATPVMFYSGYPFIRNAIRGFKNRTLNMDVLIFLGSFSAYAYSIAIIFLTTTPIVPFTHLPVKTEVYFDTSAMIITLILLGRFIEAGAKLKASSSLQTLLSLQPQKARLLKNQEEVLVSVKELKEGDLIVVKPGEKIPVDGVVIEGSSEVDEKMLTGESIPSLKTAGSQVFSGTINVNGRLIIETRSVKDTLLGKITQAVLDAQTKRPEIQTIADKVVAFFVPGIVFLSLLTFLYWYLNKDTTTAIMNAVSVLVIACPCALGLATPLAILISSSSLYSTGIILKDGTLIEKVAKANTVCLDKTGTLTEGRPALIDIIAYEGSKEELHLIAASLESASEHVVARAITEGRGQKAEISATERQCDSATANSPLNSPSYLKRGGVTSDFQSFPGMGVKGKVRGSEVIIGNRRFLELSGIEIKESQKKDLERYAEKGYTVVGMAIDRRLKAWFVIADRIPPSTFEAIKELKKMNKEIILLTGDQRKVAEEVASKLGIEKVYAEVLPVEKAEIIKRLKAEEDLIMVGDGINDAPALSTADAGIATGGAADIAAECAGAVFMRKDLNLLITLFKVSEKTLSIIKQNLFWAFSYNIIAIPLAISGKIHPVISAILMAVSSLLVVGNSLRLKNLT